MVQILQKARTLNATALCTPEEGSAESLNQALLYFENYVVKANLKISQSCQSTDSLRLILKHQQWQTNYPWQSNSEKVFENDTYELWK